MISNIKIQYRCAICDQWSEPVEMERFSKELPAGWRSEYCGVCYNCCPACYSEFLAEAQRIRTLKKPFFEKAEQLRRRYVAEYEKAANAALDIPAPESWENAARRIAMQKEVEMGQQWAE